MAVETTMWADYVALQAALPKVKQDATNPHFRSKYASLDHIQDVVFPVLAKHNFAFMAKPSTVSNHGEIPTLWYGLVHASGDIIGGEMPLLLKSNDPQGQGSALTYARRYALSAILGLSTGEDDDGNVATAQAKTGAVPLTTMTKNRLRTMFADQDLKGEEATEFIRGNIEKDQPETEQDAGKLLVALARRKGGLSDNRQSD
jgi:hypothetical protein